MVMGGVSSGYLYIHTDTIACVIRMTQARAQHNRLNAAVAQVPVRRTPSDPQDGQDELGGLDADGNEPHAYPKLTVGQRGAIADLRLQRRRHGDDARRTAELDVAHD